MEAVKKHVLGRRGCEGAFFGAGAVKEHFWGRPDGKQCQHALFGGTRMLRCQYVFFAGNCMISCRTEGKCVCLSSNHPQTVFMKCPLNFRSISAQFPLEAPILQGFEHFLLNFLSISAQFPLNFRSISARCVDLVFSAPLPPYMANFGATPKNKA